MTDEEANRFEHETMPFGRYKDVRIGQIDDLDYLEWLSDQSRFMWLKLHRYLNSPRVKRERTLDYDY